MGANATIANDHPLAPHLRGRTGSESQHHLGEQVATVPSEAIKDHEEIDIGLILERPPDRRAEMNHGSKLAW
jgi:hypothetical protein